MDPAKSARTENVEIIRDRVHITLLDGTNSICPAGERRDFRGRVSWERKGAVEPPNPIEAQQLALFTSKTSWICHSLMPPFSFTDGLA